MGNTLKQFFLEIAYLDILNQMNVSIKYTLMYLKLLCLYNLICNVTF